MNNGIVAVISGVLGAAVGALAAGLYLKKKYEEKANEEIAEMRKKYLGLERESEKKPEEKNEEKAVSIEDIEIVNEPPRPQDIYEEAAHHYQGTDPDSNKEPMNYISDIIDPEDFETLDGYEGYHFIVYTDGDRLSMKCLEDHMWANIYQYLDEGQLAYFLENESITLRNTDLKEDYQIDLEARNG